MPGLVEHSSGCRVLLVPETALQEREELKILKLRHPRTGEAAHYLLNSGSSKLNEILAFREELRSWFIGDRIVEDGSLLLSTPVDPTFIILPYLMKADKNVPLDDLLDDPDFPHFQFISSLSAGLSNVGQQLGDKDLNVWKYNEESCLDWLARKVKAVSAVLESQQIDVTGGAASHSITSTGTSVEYLRYGMGIVCEYLPVDLQEKLASKLDLPAPTHKKAEPVIGKRGAEDEKKGPPNKKVKQEDPCEDYSKSYKNTGEEKKVSTPAMKKNAAAAKGTKNIMSFFAKNKKKADV